MSLYTFPLISSGLHDLEVIWIDDIFQSDRRRTLASGGSHSQELVNLDTVKEFLADKNRDKPIEPMPPGWEPWERRIYRLYHACRGRGVKLSCANFEWADQTLSDGVPDGIALLIDVENEFAQPPADKFYGVKLVERKRLKPGDAKWKFWTRWRDRNIDKYGRWIEEQSFSVGADISQLSDWIKSLIFTFCPDPAINEVLEIYSRPWRQGWEKSEDGWYWSHEEIRSNAKYRNLLAEWLEVPILEDDIESVKGLGMRKESSIPWNLNDHKSHCVSSRTIRTDILAAVLSKIGLRFSEEIPLGRNWHLPISPGIPFLTALRAFVWRMENEGAAPVRIRLRCNEAGEVRNKADVYSLAIHFREGQNGRLSNDFGLASTYEQKKAAIIDGFCGDFDDLIHCRTGGLQSAALISGSGDEWLKPFKEGTSFPCAGPVFGKYAVTLCWIGQPADHDSSE